MIGSFVDLNGMNMSTTQKPLLGVALVLIAALLLASHDGLSKHLATIYPVFLVIWMRYLMQTVGMAVIFMPKMGMDVIKAQRPRLQLLRGISLMSIGVLFINGLRFIPLAEATAVMFLAPLFVTLLSAWLLREKVSQSQWWVIGAGLLGVLLIVRPGSALFSPAILYPLGASMSFACYQLLTRYLGRTDHNVTSNFLSSLVGTIALAPFALGNIGILWQMPILDVWMISVLGLIGMVAHMLLTSALKYSSPATLAPFTYAQIIYAGIIGWLAFGQAPDALGYLGVAIIIGSAVLVAVLNVRSRKKVGY